MENARRWPKCGSQNTVRVPDAPNRHASGNNISPSSMTLTGKIPVIRYVCCDCGHAENWVETRGELKKTRSPLVNKNPVTAAASPCGPPFFRLWGRPAALLFGKSGNAAKRAIKQPKQRAAAQQTDAQGGAYDIAFGRRRNRLFGL